MRIYPRVFHYVLRRCDPELCHELTVAALATLHAVPVIGPLVLRTAFARGARTWTSTTVARMHVPGYFGLAAGFDKNAKVALALVDMGFTHVEVGTVTPRPQPGQDKPRSFRLVQDRALINRMGFNNDGAAAMARRLRKVRASRAGRSAVIGVNIGKNKTTPLEHAWRDYEYCTRMLERYASYIAINVSSPNTPQLRSLQSMEDLAPIISTVRAHTNKPVFVKIAPDLHDDDIRAIAALALEMGVDGIIATNTTIERPSELRTSRHQVLGIGAGGLSGPVLAPRALDVLRILDQVREGTGPDGRPARLALISCGGITHAAQVKERLDAGADLVQGYTGMIYEGPAWPGRIHRELESLL